MTRELLLATHNRDKIRELAHALLGIPLEVRSADDVGEWPEVEETGATLEENALLKVEAAVLRFGRAALADDTGLEVDALDGAPGVWSSRYAGASVTYADNVRKLLRDLAGVPAARRTARFRCVIAIADPDGRRGTVAGAVEGTILEEPRGTSGFGYDPVFFVPQLGRSFAELSLEEKRGISHRGRAIAAARKLLLEWYGEPNGE